MAKEEGGNSGGDMPAEEATGEAAPIKKEDEI
jgi:hypothetical protein